MNAITTINTSDLFGRVSHILKSTGAQPEALDAIPLSAIIYFSFITPDAKVITFKEGHRLEYYRIFDDSLGMAICLSDKTTYGETAAFLNMRLYRVTDPVVEAEAMRITYLNTESRTYRSIKLSDDGRGFNSAQEFELMASNMVRFLKAVRQAIEE